MSDWQEFVNRSLHKYEASWIQACSLEGTELEILELVRCCEEERKVFVDTNIPFDILKEISDYNPVVLMLSEPDIFVNHFFDRPDLEKQFLY